MDAELAWAHERLERLFLATGGQGPKWAEFERALADALRRADLRARLRLITGGRAARPSDGKEVVQ